MNQVMVVTVTHASGKHVVDLIAHGGAWWCICMSGSSSPTGEPLFGMFRWHGDEIVWQLCVPGPEAVVRKFRESCGFHHLVSDRGMTQMSDLRSIVKHIKEFG